MCTLCICTFACTRLTHTCAPRRVYTALPSAEAPEAGHTRQGSSPGRSHRCSSRRARPRTATDCVASASSAPPSDGPAVPRVPALCGVSFCQDPSRFTFHIRPLCSQRTTPRRLPCTFLPLTLLNVKTSASGSLESCSLTARSRQAPPSGTVCAPCSASAGTHASRCR